MVRWIIHLKSGKSFTDKDGLPSDYPQDQITSVERIISDRHYVICNSPFFRNFFVKTSASQTYTLIGGGPPGKPVVTERILGCYFETKDGPVRLELAVDPNGNCKLSTKKVKKVTLDGF